MRRSYLVCYDVRSPKRLRRIHRKLKGYGEPWQYSVFFCTLRNIDRVRLQADIEDVLNLKEDQALIIDLGPDEERARESASVVGQPLPESKSGTVVI